MKFIQKNLFGISTQAEQLANPVIKAKSAFPELSLAKGLNVPEARTDAVFWQRVLLNNAIRKKNSRQFLQVLANEIKLKKGTKDAYLAILDSLKHGL